jgi:hypothetical protein
MLNIDYKIMKIQSLNIEIFLIYDFLKLKLVNFANFANLCKIMFIMFVNLTLTHNFIQY